MAPIPIPCEHCGTRIYLPFHLAVGQSLEIRGKAIATCSHCGETTAVPEGVYELVSMTQEAISDWSAQRREQFVAGIAKAKEGADPREAVTQAIKKEPELSRVAQLLIPRDAAAFWAFVMVMLAVFHGGHSTIVEQQINHPTYIEQVQTSKPPPRPPKRRKAKGNGRRNRKR